MSAQRMNVTSVTRRAPRRRHDRLLQTAILVIAGCTFFPVLFQIMTSFKDQSQFQHRYWLPDWPLHFENYGIAWNAIRIYLWNSVYITTLSVIASLTIATVSAYVFARYRFPGRTALFYLVLGLLMIPSMLTFIPRFILVRNLHLFNTPWALILPYTAFGLPFAIFVLRSFFAGIPQDLLDAAKIDGASEAQVFVRVALPLSYAPIAAVAIVQVLEFYNDYLWPLITLSDDRLKTATVGVVRFTGAFGTQYGPLMAGYLIMAIPLVLLFLVAMRYFVEGIASGALKF